MTGESPDIETPKIDAAAAPARPVSPVDAAADMPLLRIEGVSKTFGNFRAVYYKPANQPQLILRERSRSDNHELMAKAWKAASDKARELGWIV
jgi:hypothetical protein